MTFANTLNQKLTSCPIVLQSYVSEVVDEQICEPITPRKVKRANKRPECFEAVFLDLISGLLYRKMGSVSEWLDMYGRQQEGFIQFMEFKAALDRADV